MYGQADDNRQKQRNADVFCRNVHKSKDNINWSKSFATSFELMIQAFKPAIIQSEIN